MVTIQYVFSTEKYKHEENNIVNCYLKDQIPILAHWSYFFVVLLCCSWKRKYIYYVEKNLFPKPEKGFQMLIKTPPPPKKKNTLAHFRIYIFLLLPTFSWISTFYFLSKYLECFNWRKEFKYVYLSLYPINCVTSEHCHQRHCGPIKASAAVVSEAEWAEPPLLQEEGKKWEYEWDRCALPALIHSWDQRRNVTNDRHLQPASLAADQLPINCCSHMAHRCWGSCSSVKQSDCCFISEH